MTNALIKVLHDRRLGLETQIRSMITQATEEKRELSSEENTTLDKMAADADGLAVRISDMLEAEQRAADVVDKLGVYGKAELPAVNALEKQVRSFLKGETRSIEFAPKTADEKRDISTSTGGTPYGGYTVAAFYDRLVEHMIEVSGIMQSGATIVNTANGEPRYIPQTSSYSSAVIVGEGSQLTESQPVFAQASLPVYKYGLSIQVTKELVEDTNFDLLGFLARQAGRAVGNGFGVHAITGDGSSKPYGVVAQATVGVTGATSVTGAASAANLIDLYHSVIQPYRNSPSCGWLMRDASVGAIRKLTDATSGQFLWQPGLQASQPDMLLGKPLRTDPNVAAAGVSGKSILFGDFSTYWVRMAGNLRFERSDEFAFDYDLVTFRCLARMGGVLTDTTGAVKYFIGGGS